MCELGWEHFARLRSDEELQRDRELGFCGPLSGDLTQGGQS